MKKEDNFLLRFEKNIIENRLLKKGACILVGFSGGADSTALLLALWHLRTKFRFKLLAAHIKYNLRPEENEREKRFITSFCFARNIPILINEYKPVKKFVNEQNLRQYRQKWFSRLTRLYHLDVIALGHNRGDQAETILYRLLRGSLLTGLGGIKAHNGKIIHPMLPFSRQEIIDFLQREQVEWCEDSSNKKNHYTRNKIRNIGMKLATKHINPQAELRLSETGNFLQQADEILKSIALRRLKHQIISRHNEEEIRLNIPELFRLKPVLRFYIYRYMYSEVNGLDQDFYQNNFNEIEEALQREGNRSIQLPNDIIIEKIYDELIFFPSGKPPEDSVSEEARELNSLRNRFSYGGWRVSMKKLKVLPRKRNPFQDKYTAFLDYDKIKLPITVRHRQSGDRFIPFGLNHRKKIKDYFIDRKVSPRERDRTLVFTDSDSIMWLGGFCIDQRFAVTKNTANILMIKIEKISRRRARPAERQAKRH